MCGMFHPACQVRENRGEETDSELVFLSLLSPLLNLSAFSSFDNSLITAICLDLLSEQRADHCKARKFLTQMNSSSGGAAIADFRFSRASADIFPGARLPTNTTTTTTTNNNTSTTRTSSSSTLVSSLPGLL